MDVCIRKFDLPRRSLTGRNGPRVVRHGASLTTLAVALLMAGGPALANDPSAKAPKSDPWSAALREGYDAYNSGQKNEAFEAYRYAAENGKLGARWAMARMYARGEGVERNDYEAFKSYMAIVEQGVEPGSGEDAYLADALVAAAGYLRSGIPDSPVRPNPGLAQEFYRDAATLYRNPVAQYELGRMLIKTDDAAGSLRQAGNWLKLAANNGHAGAQAMLGSLWYRSGKIVRGLAMMTAALEKASPVDRPWIVTMQEEAFSLASEADRRTAVALAQDMVKKADK